jgi:hypothetical protein
MATRFAKMSIALIVRSAQTHVFRIALLTCNRYR